MRRNLEAQSHPSADKSRDSAIRCVHTILYVISPAQKTTPTIIQPARLGHPRTGTGTRDLDMFHDGIRIAIMLSRIVSLVWNTLIACCIVSLLVHRFLIYRRLRHFKGPWLATFSKLWLMKSTFNGTVHLDVADVCRKYGNLTSDNPSRSGICRLSLCLIAILRTR